MRPFYNDGGSFRREQPHPVVGVIFMVMMVIFWAVVVYGLWLLINKYAKNNDTKSNDALSIAKTRYAKGEISKEEFSALKKDLS